MSWIPSKKKRDSSWTYSFNNMIYTNNNKFTVLNCFEFYLISVGFGLF